MRIEIIELNGDLKREVWEYYLHTDFENRINLESYSFQERATKRHGWKPQSWWQSLDKRQNTMDKPVTPLRIEVQVKQRCKDFIDAIPIK